MPDATRTGFGNRKRPSWTDRSIGGVVIVRGSPSGAGQKWSERWGLGNRTKGLVGSVAAGRASGTDQQVIDAVDDAVGDLLFAAADRIDQRAARRQQFDVVVERVDRFGAVADDQVTVLLVQFDRRPEPPIVGFEGEADDPLAGPFRSSQQGDDVLGFDQLDHQRLSRLGNLAVGDLAWLVIARSGGPDRAVTIGEQFDAAMQHFVGGDDGMDFRAGRVIDRDRAADDDHRVAVSQASVGQGRAHSAAGGIRQVPHRIEVLSSRAGGDQDFGQTDAVTFRPRGRSGR